jgi:hypothetical protein
VVIPDVATDPAFAPHCAIAQAAGFGAVQSTPMVSRPTGPSLGCCPHTFAGRAA